MDRVSLASSLPLCCALVMPKDGTHDMLDTSRRSRLLRAQRRLLALLHLLVAVVCPRLSVATILELVR